MSLNQKLEELSVGAISQASIAEYAEVSHDENPLHIDRGFALAYGLANTIIHGTMLCEFQAVALRRWFPSHPILCLSTSFLAPAFEGSSLTIIGRVFRDTNDAHSQFQVRIVTRTADHKIVAVGEARMLDLANSAECNEAIN